MNLQRLTNKDLNLKVIELARQEKELLADAIVHIAEVERRKLYFDYGITSLYQYLTKQAGFSNGSAYRLMDAARLQLEVPHLAEKIEADQINMTQVRLVQEASRQRDKQIRNEAAQGTLLNLMGASELNLGDASQLGLSEGAENLSDPATSFSAGANDSLSMAPNAKPEMQKAQILETIQGLSVADSQRLVAQSFDLELKKPLKVSRQKDGSVLVEMTFSAAQWAELDTAKETISSSLPTGSYPEVIAHLAQKENAQRRKEAKPRPNTLTLTPAKKKSVLLRDRCCQLRDPHSGEICASKFNLQIDHIEPQWAGGSHEVENLQILCAAHNRLKYQKEAGIRYC